MGWFWGASARTSAWLAWPPAENGARPKALLMTQGRPPAAWDRSFAGLLAGSGGWTHLGMSTLGLDCGLFALGRTDSRPRRLGSAVVGIRAFNTEARRFVPSRLPSGARGLDRACTVWGALPGRLVRAPGTSSSPV